MKEKKVQTRQPLKKSRETSLNLLKVIADTYAHQVWGTDVATGEPLPILDERGHLIQYAFPFAKYRSKFPNSQGLIRKFRRWSRKNGLDSKLDNKAKNQQEMQAFRNSIRTEITRFGTVYVSARRDQYPVSRISEGLHPFFYNQEAALQAARSKYRMVRPRLNGIRLISPCHEYFEIEDRGKKILLQVNSLENEKLIQAAADEFQPKVAFHEASEREMKQRREEIKRTWSLFDDTEKFLPEGSIIKPDIAYRPAPGFIDYKIPNYQRVPPILWTGWCAPTAAAMVIAHWDRYLPSPGVGTGAYERIVDYWHDHPSNGNNVPNLLDEIIASPTYEHFANTLNGYQWSFKTKIGDTGNDWCWNDLVAELHAGRPARWQIYPPGNIPGHAVCVFGYQKLYLPGITQKYIIHYNTWNELPDRWLYNHFTWNGSGVANHIELNTYIPGGMEYNRSFYLRYPFGGEVYKKGKKNLIHFYAGSDIKITRIDYSGDGGRNWKKIVEMEVQQGWNSFGWKFPNISTDKGRIRIQGFSANRTYLAGDGSFTNFSLQ